MLINTGFCLTKKKALTVGYFGGSITEGTGASKEDQTCWRALTGGWLRTAYPDADIRLINAAIGGTGSDLGIYRLQNDLLCHAPDLVFVEFAVNDCHLPAERVVPAMEGIVRFLRQKNPYVDIVFIYTCTKQMHDAIKANAPFPSIALHRSVAAHYGIDSIDVGAALMHKIDSGVGSWETFTVDNVHPNDSGYQIYADCVIQYLKKAIVPGTKAVWRNLPAPLYDKVYVSSRLIDAWRIQKTDFEKVSQSMQGRYPHFICASRAGQYITFAFSGTDIGLYHTISHDSGDYEWSIDGGPFQRASTWDTYALQFDRACYRILRTDLDRDRHHTLTLRVLGEKNIQSEGTFVRIGALLVGDKVSSHTLYPV